MSSPRKTEHAGSAAAVFGSRARAPERFPHDCLHLFDLQACRTNQRPTMLLAQAVSRMPLLARPVRSTRQSQQRQREIRPSG